jgi:hypothetical protein
MMDFHCKTTLHYLCYNTLLNTTFLQEQHAADEETILAGTIP